MKVLSNSETWSIRGGGGFTVVKPGILPGTTEYLHIGNNGDWDVITMVNDQTGVAVTTFRDDPYTVHIS